jgi:hypothetical protein
VAWNVLRRSALRDDKQYEGRQEHWAHGLQ